VEDSHELATKTDKQLSVHEAICAARYEAIQKSFEDWGQRMKRLEYILYFSILASLFGPKYLEELLKKIMGV
jgi:hypothetical protein